MNPRWETRARGDDSPTRRLACGTGLRASASAEKRAAVDPARVDLGEQIIETRRLRALADLDEKLSAIKHIETNTDDPSALSELRRRREQLGNMREAMAAPRSESTLGWRSSRGGGGSGLGFASPDSRGFGGHGSSRSRDVFGGGGGGGGGSLYDRDSTGMRSSRDGGFDSRRYGEHDVGRSPDLSHRSTGSYGDPRGRPAYGADSARAARTASPLPALSPARHVFQESDPSGVSLDSRRQQQELYRNELRAQVAQQKTLRREQETAGDMGAELAARERRRNVYEQEYLRTLESAPRREALAPSQRISSMGAPEADRSKQAAQRVLLDEQRRAQESVRATPPPVYKHPSSFEEPHHMFMFGPR
eukprot:Amastigsp_a340218_48.p1 type:complete len:363 gc:universal Amastigsp_a340218_48:45-1133(+)